MNSGNITLYANNKYPGTHTTLKNVVKHKAEMYSDITEIVVPIITLDDYVKKKKISKDRQVDLIKIDVEFIEGEVLIGAKEVLRMYKPDVICEILSVSDVDYRIRNRDMIQSVVDELRYSAYWISDKGLIYESNIKGHSPESGCFNYLLTARKL